jgi:RNA polymerase sigma-70 factor (ECF subfamily)
MQYHEPKMLRGAQPRSARGPRFFDRLGSARIKWFAEHAIRSFSDGNARAWVLTIVRHTAYDWLHKNRPATLVLVDDLEDLQRTHLSEQDVATPETAILAQEEKTVLEAAIATLSPHYRETLVLRDVRGLTYREISDLTGSSIGTVMSRLFRARRHLITIMAENAVPTA